jgi:hypothetical protein
MARHPQHETYLAHSPAYADMFANYGASVPIMVAANWVESHSLSIPDLIEGGDLTEEDFEHNLARERTRVHTLPLLMAMGY